MGPNPRYQQSVDDAELAQLARQWGLQPRETVRLAITHPFLTGEHQLLVSNRRRAEICYIMHRGDPAAGVLLHIKTIYPPGAYRLPTGGIHQGQTVVDTLAREIYEETGLRVGSGADEVRVERMLGVQHYRFDHAELGEKEFATYHFLVRMPVGGTLDPQDADEQIGGWRWCPAAELNDVASVLSNVGTTAPEWADWGRFRALAHWFVAEQLKTDD